MCKYCPTPTVADLQHCFFGCIKTELVGRSLLAAVRQHDSSVTAAGLLRLEFQDDGDKEMPLIWVAAQTLLYLWTSRVSGRVVDLYVTRSILETKVNLLRETRFTNHQILINEIIDEMM